MLSWAWRPAIASPRRKEQDPSVRCQGHKGEGTTPPPEVSPHFGERIGLRASGFGLQVMTVEDEMPKRLQKLLEALYEFVVLFFKLAGFQSKQPLCQVQKGAHLGSRTPCHAHEMEIISSGSACASFDDVGSRGYCGAAQLRWQTLSLFLGKCLGALVDANHPFVCLNKHA